MIENFQFQGYIEILLVAGQNFLIPFHFVKSMLVFTWCMDYNGIL